MYKLSPNLKAVQAQTQTLVASLLALGRHLFLFFIIFSVLVLGQLLHYFTHNFSIDFVLQSSLLLYIF